MYDKFSSDYDRFVNWNNRLAAEMPFLEKTITKTFSAHPSNVRILDAATGTGMHAIELAKRGYETAGADLSPGMIRQARLNAEKFQSNVRFETAGFGNLAETFERMSSLMSSEGPELQSKGFDVVLCLGNSLPHVGSKIEFQEALIDFSNCLKDGGLLIIQNRNFDSVMAARDRWMEPQAFSENENEWLFLRFYDYLPNGMINFNIVTLTRKGQGGWKQTFSETRLMPILSDEIGNSLGSAGFEKIRFFGGLDGSEFNPSSSGNLVITAVKK